MRELSKYNPTGRFSGLAYVYAKYRPSYPDSVVDFILARAGLEPGSLLVDVGSGTGISSRLFGARGLQVLGLEPNGEMRASAAAEKTPAGFPAQTFKDGHAEATGLADGCADAVLAAQAFHWFIAESALREFRRILKPHGWAILMWNERDERDPLTAAYGAVIRTVPDAAAVETPRGRAGEPLLASKLFDQCDRVLFHNEQALDEQSLLGRALSASYAPRHPDQVAKFTDALKRVFARYQQGGRVVVHYETSVYMGQRRDDL